MGKHHHPGQKQHMNQRNAKRRDGARGGGWSGASANSCLNHTTSKVALIRHANAALQGESDDPTALNVLAMIALMLPTLYVRRNRGTRMSDLETQLPDALELIARSLKAGHPLPVALTLAAREIADPLGSEFGIFSDELAYGLPMSKALRNLQVRVGQEDLGVLATGIIIQNEVGGNLIELVSSLSNLLRERVKMRRKVRVLTSEGRMSGAMLSALPIFIFLALNLVSPKFYGEVWDKPIVTVFLVGGFIWMLLGNFVIYRMVNFKY